LLYEFALKYFEGVQVALLTCIFLIFNSYWILHSRQCRYYALSSLFLIVTLATYARWQRGGRASAALFVMAAWCWFQVDYGTVWPVLGVLFIDAFFADRRRLWRPLLIGAVLATSIAPFAYYYELWKRLSVQDGTWSQRFLLNLFNANEYVVPLVIGGAAAAIMVHRRKTLPVLERRLISGYWCVLATQCFAALRAPSRPFTSSLHA